MKKLFLASLTVGLFYGSLFAFSKVGTVGAQFLKIPIDPKGIGMGGAYTALSTDPSAIYWNPAGLGHIKKASLYFSDVEWFAGIRNNFIAYVQPMLRGVIGFSVSALTSSPEPVTTEEQFNGTGEEWHYTAIVGALSYGKMMTDKVSIGLNLKFIQERIWDIVANGISIDMGIYFYPGYWKTLRFGFVVKNFGPDMTFGGGHLRDKWREEGTPSGVAPWDIELKPSPYKLPLAFKFGIAYDIIEMKQNKLTAEIDFSHPNDGAEKIHLGLQSQIVNILFIRAGYTYDSDARIDREDQFERYCFGMGIIKPMAGQTFGINYACQDMGRLGLTHRISIETVP